MAWDDQIRYWIRPDGELLDVTGTTHDSVSREDSGISMEDAIEQGWIRVTQDSRGWWNFEVQDAADGDTLALIEDFVLSPKYRQKSTEIAAAIETREPKFTYFPVEWSDLDTMSFAEGAERSFRREARRPKGQKWYSLRGNPRKRRR